MRAARLAVMALLAGAAAAPAAHAAVAARGSGGAPILGPVAPVGPIAPPPGPHARGRWLGDVTVTEYWPAPEVWFTGRLVKAPGLSGLHHLDWLYSATGLSMQGEGIALDGVRFAPGPAKTLTYYGSLAVDPSVIPLGSRVYVPAYGDDGRGGWFVAQDTGGGVIGDHIDVYRPPPATPSDPGQMLTAQRIFVAGSG